MAYKIMIEFSYLYSYLSTSIYLSKSSNFHLLQKRSFLKLLIFFHYIFPFIKGRINGLHNGQEFFSSLDN